MSSRTSPSRTMLRVMPSDLLSGGGGSSSPNHHTGLDAEDGSNLMEVRLDNHLDDLPSPEELKTDAAPTGSRRFLRRIVLVFATVLLVIGLAILIVSVSPKRRGTGKSAGSGQVVSDFRPSRLQETISFLLDDVDREALADTSSPQYLAAKWMADEDPRRSSMADRTFYQRYALAVLWFSTGGAAHWKYDLGFMSGDHECDWHKPFQHLDRSVFPMGVQCNSNKKVKAIILQTIGLVGSIPSELKLLPELKTLSLDRNALTDMDGVKELTKVQHLTLGNNKLGSGMGLPTFLGDLHRLRTLGLSNNGYASTIPTELASLTLLKTLLLDNNKMSGDLSVLEDMPSLTALFLENNGFGGTLANDFLQELHDLEILDISGNALEGHVGRGLLRRPKLQVLDLHHNNLDGSLPEDMPHSTSLKFLALHDNFFSGFIPTSIRHLENLQHLDLSSNRFEGDLPDTLRMLSDLEFLSLAGNNHVTPGPFPTFARPLTKLKELSLRATARTGTIPHWIQSHQDLILLDLGYNRFNSSIPTQIGELQNLKYLLLNRNEFTGKVPHDMGRLLNLKLLLLDQNSIIGDATDVLCPLQIPVLVADCLEVRCTCSSHCCKDDDTETCKDEGWLSHFDPVWENRYTRAAFAFSGDAIVVPEP